MARDQLTTPKGPFKYCYVNAPDIKGAERFGGDPEFKVTQVIDEDDPKWPALKAKLDKLLDDAVEAGKEAMADANPKAKAAWKKKGITEPEVNAPYTEELDEEGEPTGRIELRFKTKAEFKDRKTGEMRKRTIPMRDGKGQIIPAKKRPLVYGGTIGRVAFATSAVFIPKDAAVFLGMYLNEIQISKLSEGGGADPFGADEDSDFDADELEEYEGNASGGDDLDDDLDDGQDDGGADLDDEIPF